MVCGFVIDVNMMSGCTVGDNLGDFSCLVVYRASSLPLCRLVFFLLFFFLFALYAILYPDF